MKVHDFPSDKLCVGNNLNTYVPLKQEGYKPIYLQALQILADPTLHARHRSLQWYGQFGMERNYFHMACLYF